MVVGSANLPHDDEPRTSLGPPRFGLRTLFSLVTCIGTWLAVWQIWGPATGLVLLLVAMVVLAHVAGNAIGSRLRDGAPEQSQPRRPRGNESPRVTVSSHQFAPVTRLSHRKALGARFVLTSVLIGAGVGFGVAWWVLSRIYPDGTSIDAIAVGCVATATLGGFFAFWISGLARTFLAAWWEAHRDSELDLRQTRIDRGRR